MYEVIVRICISFPYFFATSVSRDLAKVRTMQKNGDEQRHFAALTLIPPLTLNLTRPTPTLNGDYS